MFSTETENARKKYLNTRKRKLPRTNLALVKNMENCITNHKNYWKDVPIRYYKILYFKTKSQKFKQQKQILKLYYIFWVCLKIILVKTLFVRKIVQHFNQNIHRPKSKISNKVKFFVILINSSLFSLKNTQKIRFFLFNSFFCLSLKFLRNWHLRKILFDIITSYSIFF